MKLVAWLSRALGCFRKPAPMPAKQPVDEALDDSLKQEVAKIAMLLKSEQVSVRGLHAGEIPSDIPEIEDTPL